MALIPSTYLNAIVAIGEIVNGDFQCSATGFLYGYPGEINEFGQQLYYVFLVTNRHVVTQNRALATRYNLYNGSASKPHPLLPTWTLHPSGEDVAVTQIDPSFILSEGIEYNFFISGTHTLNRQQAKAEGISEGNGVFVLGFPLQLAGRERNYVIVRQGIIARIQDWFRAQEQTFLIDASVFPGNSGGPVLTKPEVTSFPGASPYMQCSLIGMVSSYIPYEEVAISVQTGKPRMTFQENSGLGRAVPVDAIQDTIEHVLRASSQISR